MSTLSARSSAPGRSSHPVLVVAVLLGVIGAGMLAFGRLVDDFTISVVLQTLWFAAVAAGALLYARRRPGLLRPVAGALAACAIVGAAGFWWTTIRDVEVNERVVTGVKASELAPAPAAPAAQDTPAAPAPVDVELASGSFASLAHQTSGTARVIDLADGGRRVTLTGLETDNGPDLRLYLVPGGSNPDGSVDGGVDLGRLKGNKGTQQYDVPAGTRISDGASVVIWCRAFTVAFGVAELQQS
jgi:hypothetical protein